MHLGGRAYFDNAWISSDDFAPTETQDASYWRTIRLEADGTLFTNAFFKIQVDFVGAEVALKDVYVGLKKLGSLGTLHAGHFKEPFSLEEQTSSRFVTFMERAAANAFAPARNNGIMLNNNFLEDGRLGVFLGIFRETNDQGSVAEDGGYAFTFRVAAFFLEDKETNRILHAGFGFSFRDPNDETVRYRARPDIGTGPRFVDTGDFAADEVNLFDVEVAFLYRRFHVQAEAFLVDASGAGGPEPTFTGFYVEVGWFVVGGQRHYSTDKKVIERPKIERSFHANGGGAGAWQVAFRFDTIDLTDGGVTGGVQDTFTFGANWYWNPHMVVKFNVILADVSDGGPFGEADVTIFAMRFQFDF
jgi:phosphate-selective porin OprO/OprP